jgi:hypothetical protein
MLREGLRLSRRHKALVYGAFGALLATGVLWLVFHHFLRVEGDFGAEPHPLEPLWMKAHGAAAMAFLVVLGSLVRGHVRLGWKQRRHRPSGGAIVGASLVLAATGWALYYVGAEGLRAYVSIAHWTLGLAAPVLLAAHVVQGHRARRRALGH